METILNMVTSPVWWFSVVLVGIISSLLAAYTKPHLDHWIGTFSVTWAKRNQKRKEQFERDVERLLKNEHEQLIYQVQIFRDITSGLIMMTGSFVVMVLLFLLIIMRTLITTFHLSTFGLVFGLFLSFFSMLLGFTSVLGTTRSNSVFKEVRRRVLPKDK